MEKRVVSADCRPDWPIGGDPRRGMPCVICGRQPPECWQLKGPGRYRSFCSNACRQMYYRRGETKRVEALHFENRNAAMMKAVSLIVDALMGLAS
jgi:hypothetical protein